MPDDPNVVALLYGPIVLAGDLGKEGLIISALRPQRTAARQSAVDRGSGVRGRREGCAGKSEAGAGSAAALPDEWTRPAQRCHADPVLQSLRHRYTVYWKVYSPAEWEKKKADIAAAEARRAEIERRTVDAVNHQQ